MAAGQRQRQRVRALVAVCDSKEGYLVYRLNLKHLFSANDDEQVPAQLLSFPDPVARFPASNPHLIALAAASGSNLVVAASSERRTMFHNTDTNNTASSGPDMHGVKSWPVLLPVGDDAFFAMSGSTRRYDHPGTHYEVLLRTSGGPRWSWRALREPPVRSGPPSAIICERRPSCCEATGYFVAGARVWVSLHGEGTFSFDTARGGPWRKEGTWSLPVKGRAILVSDLLGGGRQLLFGFCSLVRRFCAVDIEARPPVILRELEEDHCNDWYIRTGYTMLYKPVELAYFGGGRFCISRHSRIQGGTPQRFALSLMAVEVTPELKLLKRNIRSYLMSPSGVYGHLLPSPPAVADTTSH